MHIFVGNLEFSATEQDIRQLFERYGVVDTIRIMTDRETGRPRGFGFVEMSDDTAARAAITAVINAGVSAGAPVKNGIAITPLGQARRSAVPLPIAIACPAAAALLGHATRSGVARWNAITPP